MEVKIRDNFALADFLLRFLLFVLTLVGVLVMVTSKQTINFSTPTSPYLLYVSAKFNQLPALTYFVATLSAVSLYGIITTLVSLWVLLNPCKCSQVLSQYIVLFDLISLVFMGSATGAASSVGYIGWKGNSHTGWTQVCNVFGKFCKTAVASIIASLFGSVVLVLILLLSFRSLSKKISK